jgi:hypothetical protein
VKKETALLLGLGGVLAYYLVQKLRGAAEVLTKTGEAIGSGLYDVFHPDPVGEVTFYIVRFPDGALHSIPSRAVASDGTFINTGDGRQYKGDGKRYKLLTDRTTGARVAFLA